MSTCSATGCEKRSHARGWCATHYGRWKRNGDPGDDIPVTTHDSQEKIEWMRAAACICVDWPWHLTAGGYGQVRLGERQRRVHQVVCEMIHGPRPPWATDAAHSCGRPSCASGRHLRWDTRSGNLADRTTHGTDQRGQRHNLAKLTTAEVLEIRRRAALGESQYSLAEAMGVNRSAISRIITGKRWSHV